MADYLNPQERQRAWDIIVEAHSDLCPVCQGEVAHVDPDECEFWPQLINWRNQAAPLSLIAAWTF